MQSPAFFSHLSSILFGSFLSLRCCGRNNSTEGELSIVFSFSLCLPALHSIAIEITCTHTQSSYFLLLFFCLSGRSSLCSHQRERKRESKMNTKHPMGIFVCVSLALMTLVKWRRKLSPSNTRLFDGLRVHSWLNHDFEINKSSENTFQPWNGFNLQPYQLN